MNFVECEVMNIKKCLLDNGYQSPEGEGIHWWKEEEFDCYAGFLGALIIVCPHKYVDTYGRSYDSFKIEFKYSFADNTDDLCILEEYYELDPTDSNRECYKENYFNNRLKKFIRKIEAIKAINNEEN